MSEHSPSEEDPNSHEENNSDDERELFRIFSGLHVLTVNSETSRVQQGNPFSFNLPSQN